MTAGSTIGGLYPLHGDVKAMVGMERLDNRVR